MKRVIVHIDRLVLNGFHHLDSDGISAGIKGELVRWLADPEIAAQVAAASNAASIKVYLAPLAQEAKPQEVGRRVAQSIGKGLSR